MILRRTFVVLTAWVTMATTLFAAEWKAGMSKANITPPKRIWMSGYGSRNHPAEGKLTDLWAKVLIIEDQKGNRGLLVTLDLVGISRDLAVPLCAKIRRQYGIPREQIKICTSHTHTGPAVGRNLAPLHYLQVDKQQQALIDEYGRHLVQLVVGAVGRAVKGMAPCSMSWGSDRCAVAVNRRNNQEAEVPRLRAAGTMKGPFDHDVPVLAIRDSEGGLKCVVFGYACHATVLDFYQWSGDYPGFAQMTLEQRYPGCQAMFWAGCGADQNPLPRRKVELARMYGQRVAAAVERTLSGKMEPLAGSLRTRYREIPIRLAKLPTNDDLARLAQSKNRFEVARAKMLLEQIKSGQPLSPSYKHYPVASWLIGGEVQFVSLGGEVVVDYANRIKLEHRGKKTWVAGYSHDVMAYIPSRRVLREGGYEGGSSMVYYGLPTIWSPEIEGDILAEVKRQLKPGE